MKLYFAVNEYQITFSTDPDKLRERLGYFIEDGELQDKSYLTIYYNIYAVDIEDLGRIVIYEDEVDYKNQLWDGWRIEDSDDNPYRLYVDRYKEGKIIDTITVYPNE
jgi:hypothetical protein